MMISTLCTGIIESSHVGVLGLILLNSLLGQKLPTILLCDNVLYYR